MGKKGKRKPTDGPDRPMVRDMEPGDVIDEADQPEVLDGPEGFWQEFGPSLEHLRASKTIIVITCDRKSGHIEIDSTAPPLETFGVMYHALDQHNAKTCLPLYETDD
jgi:hypothetical protein